MLLLVLGKGKTGSLVAQVARERGHSVRVLDEKENRSAGSISGPTLASIDVVIDFTTPDAAFENIRACLALGAKIVVGTTGWYDRLPELKALAERKEGALLYGTNFSVGVLKMFTLTAELAKLNGFKFSIAETHHATKLDSPSGTALTLKKIIEGANPNTTVEIEATREGEHAGLHVVKATSDHDEIEIRHEAFNRRGFAEGAVLAAEWLHDRTGVFEFREVVGG